jgi:hypothetical protein
MPITVKIYLLLSAEILLQKCLDSKGMKIKMFIGGTIKMNLQLNTTRKQFNWFVCIIYIVVQQQLMDAKNDSGRCRRGYSCTETIEQTYVDDITDRVIY